MGEASRRAGGSERGGAIGREPDVQLLIDLLATEGVRLLTITGMSGIGKTAVADEVLRRLDADGQFWIERVALARAESGEAGERLASALAGEDDAGAGGGSPPRRRRLLLADGTEGVPHASDLIAAALDRDDDLVVLTTRLSSLGLRREQVVRLGPLALPKVGTRDPERAATSPAVRLFCDALQITDTTFQMTESNTPTIVDLCIALDGIPVALELAAARCSTLGVDAFVDLYRSSGSLALTKSGQIQGDRHGSLGATIEWTCSLLSPGAHDLLRRLTVFVGGFDWEAVVAVTSACDVVRGDGADELGRADDLGQLVAAGLVRRPEQRIPVVGDRYVIPGPIRQVLVEQWPVHPARGELRTRHAEYYLAFAERKGRDRLSFAGGRSDDALIADAENLTSALAFLVAENRIQASLSLAVNLEGMWMRTGATQAGALQLSHLLSLDPGDGFEPDAVLRCQALCALGLLDLWSRHVDLGPVAHARLEEALKLADQCARPDLALRALEVKAQVLIVEGDHRRARALCVEVLAREASKGANYWRMRFLTWRAIAANAANDTAGALTDAISARNLARQYGDDHQLLMASHVLSNIPGALEDPRAAVPDPEQLLDLARRFGDTRSEGAILVAVALQSLRTADLSTCALRVLDALEFARRTGTWWVEELALCVLVVALSTADKAEEAVELHGAIQSILPAVRARMPQSSMQIYDAALSEARASVSERAFAQALAAGGMCTWPSALALAEKRAIDLVGPGTPTAITTGNEMQEGTENGNGKALSRRELEVLCLIASGYSNKAVATSLHLTPKTVMHYTSSLYRKLGVRGRAQAVAVAGDRGLLDLPAVNGGTP